jgi:cellulose synthase/poly-beta-1,6-N-acetylglucosamine synthase-like glycosyltransferase
LPRRLIFVPLKSNTLPILLALFAFAVLTQLIYFTVFLVAFKKKRPLKQSTGAPVSVIVCAHDEEQNLRELIPILLNQNYPDFEVIVVNDRSNDETYDYLLAETKGHPRLKMVNVKDTPSHVNSKKYAITLGIRAAANDWVLLTDADCRPVGSEWIASMSEQFEDDAQFVLGFSPYKRSPGFLNHFIRFETLITALQYLSFASAGNPYMGVGRNLAYRKSLFLEKKGFNHFQHVFGGDDDLFVNQHANGKNTRIQFSASSVTDSIPEKTWTCFFHQKVRHLSVGKRYKTSDKILLGLFKASWALTWLLGLLLPVLTFLDYRLAIAAGVGLILRWIFLAWSIQGITKKSGLTFDFWLVPVLDFVYPIYYISTGLVALFTKKVRWKS